MAGDAAAAPEAAIAALFKLDKQVKTLTMVFSIKVSHDKVSRHAT
jgi:hypothetical protein